MEMPGDEDMGVVIGGIEVSDGLRDVNVLKSLGRKGSKIRAFALCRESAYTS